MKEAKKRRNEPTHNESNPDPQEIARRAYELYQERRCDPGHDFEDWLRAERELKERDRVATHH
jgi:hypothetical protein